MESEKASNLLKDVAHDRHFRLHMGANLSNLRQLSEALDIMADATFKHHVAATKNDFANWIRHAIGDEELAGSIGHLKDRKSIADKVKRRVDHLERKRSQNIICPREFLTCGAIDFLLGTIIGFVIGMIVAVIV